MGRQERFVIHTTAVGTKYIVSVDRQQYSLTPEEYQRFKEQPFQPRRETRVEIQEHAALLIGNNAEVSVEIEERRRGNAKGISVSGEVVARDGWGRVSTASTKDKVTLLAADYAAYHGEDHPPNIFERVGHLIGSIFGSDQSADWWGADAKNIPVPPEVQSGRKKAGEIDRGRSQSYRQIHQQILETENARDVGERYQGDEVDQMFMSSAPSRDTAVHVKGSFLGERSLLASCDGYTGRNHRTAEEIVEQTNGRITYAEALVIADNSIVETRGGKLVSVEPIGFSAEDLPSQQTGGVEYTIGNRVVSREEWEEKRKRRR